MYTIFDKIPIQFLRETEMQDPNNPNMFQINAKDISLVPKVCPQCGYDLVSKGIITRPICDYCSIPFNNTPKRVYKITVESRRYNCKNPEITHYITPEIIKRSPYTNSFRNYIVTYFLQHPNFPYLKIAEDYSLSAPTVSKIVTSYAQKVHLTFSPYGDYDYFQLSKFTYQSRTRYYILGIRPDKTGIPLAFFGYDHSIEEMKEYLTKCFGNQKCSIDQWNLAVNNGELIELVKNLLPDLFVFYDKKSLFAMIDQYKVDPNLPYFTDVVTSINTFKKLLSSGASDTALQKWWDDLIEIVQYYLSDLWNHFSAHISLYKLSATKFSGNIRNLTSDISYYNQMKLPFNIMALRVMYKYHETEFFQDQSLIKPFIDSDSYDLYPEDFEDDFDVFDPISEELDL